VANNLIASINFPIKKILNLKIPVKHSRLIFDTINTKIEPIFNIVESNINVAGPTGVLLLGLIRGLRHSIEADHVAAVVLLVASNHGNIKRASMLGVI
jgi:high-affinity nickel permease